MSPPDIQEEHSKKIAARWEKVSDFFFFAAQALTPSTDIPFINLIMNPIVNGCWGCSYATWALALHYNPALKDEQGKRLAYDRAQSIFNKASYIAGGVATVAVFLMLVPPLWPVIPILLLVATVATVVSNVLKVVGVGIDLYKEVKQGPHDAGRPWRIAYQASTLLYNSLTIIVAALAVAALFTPLGWAAGAGALTFAIAGAAVALGVFGISKFCQWKARKIALANSTVQSNSLSIEPQEEVKPILVEKPTLAHEVIFSKELKDSFKHSLDQYKAVHPIKKSDKAEREGEGGTEESDKPPHPPV